MAKCPGCDVQWQWDWCMDTYRQKDNGEFADEKTILEAPKEEEGVHVELISCICGVIIAVHVADPNYGAGPFNNTEWDGINWEDPEHCYPGD